MKNALRLAPALPSLWLASGASQVLAAPVAVAPFAVGSQPLLILSRPQVLGEPLAKPQRARFDEFDRARLSRQVTEHAERFLRRAPISGTLSGEVLLPLDEPGLSDWVMNLYRRNRKQRRERLATVRVALRLPDGSQRRAEATVLPRDVFLSRQLQLRAVTTPGLLYLLERFAEKAADRALARLLSEASATAEAGASR